VKFGQSNSKIRGDILKTSYNYLTTFPKAGASYLNKLRKKLWVVFVLRPQSLN